MRAAIGRAKKVLEGRKDIVGVEVGVDQGTHALEMLTLWKEIKTLHLVDDYSSRSWDHYGDARDKLGVFKDKTIWYLAKSEEAVMLFDDKSLDFAYIDASHYHDDVLADCIKWWPKVKDNGVLCGHDYRVDWENMDEHTPSWINAHGVVRAVNEFVEINNLKLGTKTDGSSSDWWII